MIYVWLIALLLIKILPLTGVLNLPNIKKSCVYPTEKKTRLSTLQNNTLKSFSLVAVIMFVQENKVGQEQWSGLEATWHSTTHNHQMKPSSPLKQDGHIQTAFWKRSLTQAVPKIIPGHYLGEYEHTLKSDQSLC